MTGLWICINMKRRRRRRRRKNDCEFRNAIFNSIIGYTQLPFQRYTTQSKAHTHMHCFLTQFTNIWRSKKKRDSTRVLSCMFDAAGPLPYILLLALDSHVSQCMHIPYIVWQNVMYFRMLRTFMFVSHWRLCVKHRHTHPHRHTHCHNIFAHIWTKLNSKHFVEYYWLFSTDLSNVLLTSCRKFVECILCSERHLMSWPETETNTTNRTNEMSFVHIFSNAFSASMELTATILVACAGQF